MVILVGLHLSLSTSLARRWGVGLCWVSASQTELRLGRRSPEEPLNGLMRFFGEAGARPVRLAFCQRGSVWGWCTILDWQAVLPQGTENRRDTLAMQAEPIHGHQVVCQQCEFVSVPTIWDAVQAKAMPLASWIWWPALSGGSHCGVHELSFQR